MPVSIKQLATNTAHVSIPLQGGEDALSVTYYPGRFTEKMIADTQMIQASNDASNVVSGFKAFNEGLASLIKDWDLYEDDDQKHKFPIDASRFSELPLAFRMQVFEAITSDIRPEAMAPQMS